MGPSRNQSSHDGIQQLALGVRLGQGRVTRKGEPGWWIPMTFELVRQWIAVLGLSGLAGTVVSLVVKAFLERKSQDREHRWQEEKERRDRAQDTDRATYNQRLTILVRENLAAFIRTGHWPADGVDLPRLLASLRQRTYEHFLDPIVNQGWELLVEKSVDLASRRISNRLRESDIFEYNRLRTEWEDSCKRSFGPLPARPEEVVPPHEPRASASSSP